MSRPYNPTDSPAMTMLDGSSTPVTHDYNPYTDTPSASTPILAQKSSPKDSQTWESTPMVSTAASASAVHRPFWRRPLAWLIALAALVVVLIAVLVPVGLVVIRKNANDTGGGGNGGNGGNGGTGQEGNPESPTGAIMGYNNSLITTENGTTFTYINNFEGYWYFDESDPFNMSAKCNSWTPALNETFQFGTTKIFGVNLGGWLVLEPFIAPSLFDPYQNQNVSTAAGTGTPPPPPAVDEWSLSVQMLNATGSLDAIRGHYETFITEEDFAQIAGAGLNWVRLPIPFWSIDVWNNEPFLAGVSWTYILKAFQWARKYGLRINLDLHTLPGSQNGYNHSGKSGQINFLMAAMGYANGQRGLDYIRTLAEFISQPENRHVEMFGIVNELLVAQVGFGVAMNFYIDAITMIRNITGIGEGKGPVISIHDGFIADSMWVGQFDGVDRIALDMHPYLAFGGAAGWTVAGSAPCQGFGLIMDQSNVNFGISVAGEFSSGWNGCGHDLSGIPDAPGDSPDNNGFNCTYWNDASQWTQSDIESVLNFTIASMDALQNWFFWTWKIGPSLSGKVEASLWSYQQGLQYGYVPPDPRVANGTCATLIAPKFQFNGTYAAPYMTGGSGAGFPNATATSIYGTWPSTFSNVGPAPASVVAGSLLYAYTPTAPIITLPTPTFTMSTQTISVKNAGDGWFDTQDTASFVTAVAGCTYPDPWNAVGSPAPTAAQCTGLPVARRWAGAAITPAP